MIPNFEKIKINIQALYTRSPVHIMPLISAFPALLFRNFCPPVEAVFHDIPKVRWAVHAVHLVHRAAVAARTRPDFAHPRRLEGLQRQAGLVQMSVPVWCCIMSMICILKVPEELRTTSKAENSTRAPVGFP